MKLRQLTWLLVPGILFANGSNHNSQTTTQLTNNTTVNQTLMAYPSTNGRDGQDAGGALTVNLGADIRLYDAKYYSLHTGYLGDVHHGGNTVYGLVGIKLGKSFEEQEIERLRAELTSYRASSGPVKATIRGSR